MTDEIKEKVRKIQKPRILVYFLIEAFFTVFILFIYTYQKNLPASLLFFLGMTFCVSFFAWNDYRESRYQIQGYTTVTVEQKEHIERRNGQGKTHFYILTVRTDAGTIQHSCFQYEYKMNQEGRKAYAVTIVNNYTKKEKLVVVPA